MKCITEFRNHEEVRVELENLYKQGYRYVVRDKDSEYLTCFSLKPKKYLDMESWGYVNPDVAGVKMAYPFRNIDVTKINWSNKSAILIKDFLDKF